MFYWFLYSIALQTLMLSPLDTLRKPKVPLGLCMQKKRQKYQYGEKMGGIIRSDKCVDVKWHWIVTSAPSGILSERCCCFFHQIRKNIIPFWLIINKYGEIMSWFVSSHYDHHYFPHEGCMKVIESMQHRTFHAFSTTKIWLSVTKTSHVICALQEVNAK